MYNKPECLISPSSCYERSWIVSFKRTYVCFATIFFFSVLFLGMDISSFHCIVFMQRHVMWKMREHILFWYMSLKSNWIVIFQTFDSGLCHIIIEVLRTLSIHCVCCHFTDCSNTWHISLLYSCICIIVASNLCVLLHVCLM